MTTMTAAPPRLTLAELEALEPRLAELRAEVEQIAGASGPSFCANAVWYGYPGHRGIKRRLVWLVGFLAEGVDPRLRSMAAYDTAYQGLYARLPDCRECQCP